jgi:hypothetical protein
MSRDAELAVTVDHQALRALDGLHRAIRRRLADDAWTRTHCTVTLAQSGRGVGLIHHARAWPLTGVKWSEQAREAVDAKPLIGLEPRGPRPVPPPPEGGLTPAQLREFQAAWTASHANALVERAFMEGSS